MLLELEPMVNEEVTRSALICDDRISGKLFVEEGSHETGWLLRHLQTTKRSIW